ncbi:MAG TPA: hypothetical protein VFV67_23650 [Actinophytocola sp.]|uniref:hypothetical protein n=1 Tax=Actinophytocola sp. TaxID=1872138 RepID=UPI002DBD9366|nr:hypothetical protein [Actinophytocola sp.]HEU5473653.1 hypothetical protein [Actinophytocola sp.]
MSIWLDVINYVRLRYEVLEESDAWLRFRLDTEGDRTQQVSVHHVRGPDGAELIEISSPVGWADKVDLRRLLELAGTVMVGGAAVVDGVALVKHAVPLADLSIQEEFERPLLLVAAHADAFERDLTGADQF